MGRHGFQPAPREVKLARGETRPSRLGGLVPTPRLVAPTMPTDLHPKARVVWRRILREMPVGVIRAADTDILRAYCESVVLYQQAALKLLAGEPVITGLHGVPVRNPMAIVVRDHRDAMLRLAREIGATPASRTSLQLDHGKSLTDEWESDMDRELGPTPRELRLVAADDG